LLAHRLRGHSNLRLDVTRHGVGVRRPRRAFTASRCGSVDAAPGPFIQHANLKKEQRTMSLLSQITCGKRPAPRRCMIHGVQGVGKSTWAATSERPIFIQTEDGLGEIDCAKFPVARGFADVMAALT